MTSVLLSDLTVRILRPREMIQGKFVNNIVLRKIGPYVLSDPIHFVPISCALGFLMDLSGSALPG